MVYKSGQIFVPFCHYTRVWQTDRRTDRRTDRILITIPRLHYMQHVKILSNVSAACHCPQNRHWSIVWSITVCWMLGAVVALTHQYLAQHFNRPTPVALPRSCNLRAKVWNVRKSQGGRYWSPASRNKAARWLCVHGALASYTFKT